MQHTALTIHFQLNSGMCWTTLTVSARQQFRVSSPVQMLYDALNQAGLLAGSNSSSSSLESTEGADSAASASTTAAVGEATVCPPAAGLSDASPAGAASNGSSSRHGRDQHQQQLAVPVAAGSGPTWSPGDPACPAWVACWSAICGVWASKWNHRWAHGRTSLRPESDESAVVSYCLGPQDHDVPSSVLPVDRPPVVGRIVGESHWTCAALPLQSQHCACQLLDSRTNCSGVRCITLYVAVCVCLCWGCCVQGMAEQAQRWAA